MGVAGYNRGRADGVGLCFSPPTIDTSKIGLKHSLAAVTRGSPSNSPPPWTPSVAQDVAHTLPPCCPTLSKVLSLPCG